jgi:hypothetical protein
MTIILFWTTVAVWPAQWISPHSSLWHRPRFTVSISQERVSRLKDHSSCVWRGQIIKEIMDQRLYVCEPLCEEAIGTGTVGRVPGYPVQNPISLFRKGILAVVFKMKYIKSLSVGEADTKIDPK